MNIMKVGKVNFGSIVFLTVCMVVIQGAPCSTTPSMAKLVCGHSDYTKWNLPCGEEVTPKKDGIQMATISVKLGTILLNMVEALDMIKDLKLKYSNERIRNTNQVNQIEHATDHMFKNGNINFKDEETKVKSSDVKEIISADYDSMAAAIMFLEQIRFNEDSSMPDCQIKHHKGKSLKPDSQMSKDLWSLSDKLATILCDFEWIQATSRNVPSTNLTCQNTVEGFCQLWSTEETRMIAEYWALRDIEKYLMVLVGKYKLI